MRFHKFEAPKEGTVYVDLDAVHAVSSNPTTNRLTRLATPSGTIEVPMMADDVLALISPPTAPDTYEEHFAKDRVAQQEQRDAIIREMRRRADERAVKDAQKEEAPQPVDISEALKQGERRCRLDELKRMQSAVNNAMYGYLHGADLERRFNAIIEARRAVLEA